MLALIMTPAQFDAHRLRQTMEVGGHQGYEQKTEKWTELVFKWDLSTMLSMLLQCFSDIQTETNYSVRDWTSTGQSETQALFHTSAKQPSLEAKYSQIYQYAEV